MGYFWHWSSVESCLFICPILIYTSVDARVAGALPAVPRGPRCLSRCWNCQPGPGPLRGASVPPTRPHFLVSTSFLPDRAGCARPSWQGARPALEPAASPRSPGGGAGDPGPGWVRLWLPESLFLSSQLGVAAHFRVSVRVCTRPGTVRPMSPAPAPTCVSTVPPAYLSLPTQQRGTCSSARHTRDGAVRVRVPLGSGVELLTTPCGNQPHQPGPVCGAGPRLQAQTPRGSEWPRSLSPPGFWS